MSKLQVVDHVGTMAKDKPSLAFDPEWLAITRALHPWFSTSKLQRPFPEEPEARALVAKEQEWVKKNIKTNRDGEILVADHQRFAMTAPGPGQEGPTGTDNVSHYPGHRPPHIVIAFLAPWYKNPQTEAFCRMLGISNLMDPPPTDKGAFKVVMSIFSRSHMCNKN
jgi:lariat debranching enzyme